MFIRMLSIAVFAPLLWLPCVSPSAKAQDGAKDSAALRTHMDHAQQFLQQRRPNLAVPEFEAVVALDPDNADAQTNLGVLLHFSHNDAKAIAHLQTAVRLVPEAWKTRALLGLAELQMHQTLTGRDHLETALPRLTEEKIRMEVGDALIESYTATGELDKAAATVSALLETRPTDSRLLLLSYHLHSDLANRDLVTLAIAGPKSAELHIVMARELARQGNEPEAIANYREALAVNPNIPGLHFELGDLLQNSSNATLRAEAETQFQAALALNPQDEKAQLMLGEIALSRGDPQAALKADSRAISLQPDDADACSEMARVLIEMNQLDRAREYLNHAIEVDPTDYVAHFRLSTLDRRQGRVEEAQQQLAEYHKYKDMKSRLSAVFHDMRLPASQTHEGDEK